MENINSATKIVLKNSKVKMHSNPPALYLKCHPKELYKCKLLYQTDLHRQ